MKTVIAIEDGQITSDSTSSARLISFKKGDEVVLNDAQADFLVECGKAKHIVANAEAPTKEKQTDVESQPVTASKKPNRQKA